jgi:hypothetical protein
MASGASLLSRCRLSVSYYYSNDFSYFCIYKRVLSSYKVNQCPLKQKCQNKFFCAFWHTKSDKRRQSLLYESGKFNYDSDVECKDQCDLSDCKYYHGKLEKLYHLRYFKTVQCKKTNCNLNNNCAFAHGDEDLRLPVFSSVWCFEAFRPQFIQKNYKTQKCTNPNHNSKMICPYYHDESDRRRDPNKDIVRIMCRYIDAKQPCPLKEQCKFWHNSYEKDFDSEVYYYNYILSNRTTKRVVYTVRIDFPIVL